MDLYIIRTLLFEKLHIRNWIPQKPDFSDPGSVVFTLRGGEHKRREWTMFYWVIHWQMALYCQVFIGHSFCPLQCLCHFMSCEYLRDLAFVVDSSIKHGGRNDVVKHMNEDLIIQEMWVSPKCYKNWNVCESTINTKWVKWQIQCLMTTFIIEHNLPVSVADSCVSHTIKK